MANTIDEFLHDLTERQLLSQEEAHRVRRRMASPTECAGQHLSQRLEPGTIPTETATRLANPPRLVLCDSVIQNKLLADENQLIFSALRIRDESPVTIHVLVPGQGLELPQASARVNGAASQNKEPSSRPQGIADVGRHGEVICVCCESLEGETLEQVVSQNGSLPLELATETLLQTARTLKRLEERGLAIGEISPDVLLLDNDGRIHLMGQHLARIPRPGNCQCGLETSSKRLHQSLARLYAYLQTACTWSTEMAIESALPADGLSALQNRSAKWVFARLIGPEADSLYPGWDDLIRDLELLLGGREISPSQKEPTTKSAASLESRAIPASRETDSASPSKNKATALWIIAGLVLLSAVVLGAMALLAD